MIYLYLLFCPCMRSASFSYRTTCISAASIILDVLFFNVQASLPYFIIGMPQQFITLFLMVMEIRGSSVALDCGTKIFKLLNLNKCEVLQLQIACWAMGCEQSAQMPESARWKQKRVSNSTIIGEKHFDLKRRYSEVDYEYVHRFQAGDLRVMRLLYLAGESSIRVRFKVPRWQRCQGMAVHVAACSGKDDHGKLDVWVNCETLVVNFNKLPTDEVSRIKFWVSKERLKEDLWNELHILSSYSSGGPILISKVTLTFYESLIDEHMTT
ncbi:hypothetical protein CAPTEDRAFT_215335 [Capitella teleta]|uniref:Uncharacterized protein n=1 Tax=Capitella teleta TaxID=283909 RepID=R7VF03_CAPTE|nr:hypothetical protein CAPTEDRAFT_215335 [Capitella teleta]|eukprot:ELU17174.1 hypothetical protein CAPTEDRAFT_215335 [Capitella teleta]